MDGGRGGMGDDIEAAEAGEATPPTRRGGRPPRARAVTGRPEPAGYELPNGIRFRRETDRNGFLIRFEGSLVDADLVDAVLAEIYRALRPRD